MQCSPHKQNKTFTCFSKDSLIKMCKAFNKQHKKNKISIQHKSKKQLWLQLRDKLSKKCKQEWCWVDQNFIKNLKDTEINYKTFKPKMPQSWKQNKNTWLSTTDINQVMKQYELKYKDFLFIGPVPLDCYMGSSLNCQLKHLNITSLQKAGIKKIIE